MTLEAAMQVSQSLVNTELEGEGKASPLQCPERWKPCPSHGWTHISDFWSLCYVKLARMWQFIAEITENQGIKQNRPWDGSRSWT